MNRDAVRGYVEQSEAVLDSSPQMDEANTKAAVLRDFLELLDWQIPQDTQLEYSVEAFGNTYKVDYALILEGTPVAFLEAKGADTSLTHDHEEQLSSYMTNKNVTYGILSNGKQYRFFQRRVDASNVDVQKVGDVALEDLPSRLAVLKAYEKDAIESGESGKILGRINELREARQTLEAEKDDLAVELSNALANEVSDSISSLAETQAKEMIDRLVEDINSEIDADGGGADEPVGGGSGGIKPTGNHLAGAIRRTEIGGNDDAKVAVFPTKESGLPFLKENNAWGFVRVGSEFEYVAMYVTGDVRQVKYFATVKDVVPPEEAELSRPIEEYADGAKIAEDKMVIRFEPESLYELEDPVPYETKYPQGLRYTTLGALRSAQTTDDML
ncbi:type I restriction enzyme HsdR N-terminal domain-containing protein [Halolamina sp. CBA1230]|uniref:type I restriction endonuclease n=1 Tax=Halolamina sp. CBA1230 TaxID=1853690 RepID=UPI0009A15AA6|nr:type I restriction enzyme HsdR N-terminal domain-containing protein [Halolamina sp. CBA1230]QKY21203.1 type I restriction enzyme HsdR N-terminal domain-containing protein [Halolamina sp. CBA1230]